MSSRIKLYYAGPSKISAARLVKQVTGLSLKECNEAIEAPYFLVTQLQYLAIIGAGCISLPPGCRCGTAVDEWGRTGLGCPDLSEA